MVATVRLLLYYPLPMATHLGDRLGDVPAWVDETMSVLGLPLHRETVEVLPDLTPCSFDRLRTEVCAVEGQDNRAAAHQPDHLRLYHSVLPRLIEVGLIDLREGDVYQQPHPAWETQLMDTVLSQDREQIGGVLECLADPPLREILWSLEQSPTIGKIEDLRDRLLEDAVPEPTLAIELHHRLLPKLAAEDLLAYSQTTGDLTYHGDPRIKPVLTTIRDLFRDGPPSTT